MKKSEMWVAGETVRKLRPKEVAREITAETKGLRCNLFQFCKSFF